MVTAPGWQVDFVSRYFAPNHGIDEDPVTGSNHCLLIPYWAERLGKTELVGRQISARGGELKCSLKGDRVEMAGKAVRYLSGISRSERTTRLHQRDKPVTTAPEADQAGR